MADYSQEFDPGKIFDQIKASIVEENIDRIAAFYASNDESRVNLRLHHPAVNNPLQRSDLADRVLVDLRLKIGDPSYIEFSPTGKRNLVYRMWRIGEPLDPQEGTDLCVTEVRLLRRGRSVCRRAFAQREFPDTYYDELNKQNLQRVRDHAETSYVRLRELLGAKKIGDAAVRGFRRIFPQGPPSN